MGMQEGQVEFVIGVDTHRDTHTAAVCDPAGALLVQITVATTTVGHRQLLGLAQRHASGRRMWAVEGTGSFGAGLAGLLTSHGELVVEVVSLCPTSHAVGAVRHSQRGLAERC